MFEENPHFALDRDKHDTLFIRCPDERLTIPMDEYGDVLLVVEPAPALFRWN